MARLVSVAIPYCPRTHGSLLVSLLQRHEIRKTYAIYALLGDMFTHKLSNNGAHTHTFTAISAQHLPDPGSPLPSSQSATVHQATRVQCPHTVQ